MRSFINCFHAFVCLILVGVLIAPMAHPEVLTEKEKIEALIQVVASMENASFLRNGSEYSAKNAAKFLRGKWDANQKQIHTAKDFIEIAATKSSTTGKPYHIRFQDGRQKPCAEILLAELKRIESTPAP
jgi:hypothetical protein